MDLTSLQSHNPENEVIASLAGSGVSVPGPDEGSRATLQNNLRESTASMDLIERAMVDGAPSVPQAQAPAAPQYQPQAPVYAPPPAAQGPDPNELIRALQVEQARNRELTSEAEMARSFRELLQEDPELANIVLAKINGQPLPTQGQPPPAADGNPPPQVDSRMMHEIRAMRKEFRSMQEANQEMGIRQEAQELAAAYPGLFNFQAAETYRRNQGFRSLKDSWAHQFGAAMMSLVQAQAMAQRQQQFQQPQQQMQQAPMNSQPPPAAQASAHDMQVMRPGASQGTEVAMDQIRNFRPGNLSQLKNKIRAFARNTGMVS